MKFSAFPHLPLVLLLICFNLPQLGWTQQGQPIRLDDEFTFQNNKEDVKVRFSVDGNIYAPTTEKAYINLYAKLDLSEFEKKLTPILHNAIGKYDECGERLRVVHANIINVANGRVKLRVSLQFQDWECFLGAKTRLFSQSGTIDLEVSPIPKGRGLDFEAKVVDVSATGILGSLIAESSDIRREVIKMIERELPDAFEATFPEELKAIEVIKVQSAHFSPGLNLDLKLYFQSDISKIWKLISLYGGKS